MLAIDTETPESLLSQARYASPADRPVVFVRFYPQLGKWLTYRAMAPLQPRISTDPSDREMTAISAVGTRSFAVTASAASLLQPVFARPGAAVAFSDLDLHALQTHATVIRTVHLVHAVGRGAAQHPPRTGALHSRPAQQTLTYRTVPSPPADKTWLIRWHLARTSPKGGWIVQHIVGDTALTARTKVHLDYWEAWRVDAGSADTDKIDSYSYDDMFRAPHGFHAQASARFYEGLLLPSSFIVNNPKTAAHILPSTTQNPKLPLKQATPAVNRSWTAP